MFGEHFAQNMFIAEQEGLATTRTGRFNAALKEIEATDITSTVQLNCILKKYNLGKLEADELVKVIKASGMK